MSLWTYTQLTKRQTLKWDNIKWMLFIFNGKLQKYFTQLWNFHVCERFSSYFRKLNFKETRIVWWYDKFKISRYKFHIIFTTCKIFFDFIPIVAYFFLKKVFRKWESNWKINNQYQYLHGFCGWKWTELYKAYQKCSLIWQFFYSVQWSVCVLYLVEMNLWLRHKASRHRCSMEIKWRQQ